KFTASCEPHLKRFTARSLILPRWRSAPDKKLEGRRKIARSSVIPAHLSNVSAPRQDLQRFRNDLDDDRSDRECGDFRRVDRIADAGGTAPHRPARYALRHYRPGRSRGSGTNYSRRHWDSYALAQSGRRNHPVPVRAQNAFWGTGFQTRIARGGARPGRVSAGSAFDRGTGRDDGGDRADG